MVNPSRILAVIRAFADIVSRMSLLESAITDRSPKTKVTGTRKPALWGHLLQASYVAGARKCHGRMGLTLCQTGKCIVWYPYERFHRDRIRC